LPVNELDPKGARRVALRMVMRQVVVTAAIAAIFWGLRGQLDAVSALMGGGIGIAASLAMVMFVFRESAQGDPQRIMRNAYKGEVAKIALTIVLFGIVLKFLEVAALPLFLAYIAALLMHWVALVRR
jgi:ATP synthase protein I